MFHLHNNVKKMSIAIFFILLCCVYLYNVLKLNFFDNIVEYTIIPAQTYIHSSVCWLKNKFAVITDMIAVENQNIELKNKIALYELNEHRYSMIEIENNKLRKLINLCNQYKDYKLTGAHVIAKDTNNWFDTFVIDKGTKHGVKDNMPVLDSHGLIGKVMKANNNYSKVISIINEQSTVSAKNLRTDDIGFIKGDIKLKSDFLCQLIFFDKNINVMQNDEIVTSQLSEIFPPGLPLGNIKEIIYKSNMQTITLQPKADLKHIDYVFVMLKEKNYIQ